MATLNFTYDFRVGGALFGQMDGRAEVDETGVVLVTIEDLDTGRFVPAGPLELDVRRYLRDDPYYRKAVDLLVVQEAAERVRYDRERAASERLILGRAS